MINIDNSEIKTLITLAIKEDIGDGDITSDPIFSDDHISNAKIISRNTGIFCGIDVIKKVYELIDPNVKITALTKDGDKIYKNTETVKISGPTKSILAGERLALNFVQRMSGIATKTNQFVEILTGTEIKILDTRKTLPGFRMLDKYSVKTGGGTNHRIGLYDMVMIKDNHIQAAGSITEAVNKIREQHGNKFKIEVETTNTDEVQEAVNSGADIIMLDNMDREMIEKSINIINIKAEIEISGNIDEKKIADLKDLDIDYFSIGALTHSVKAFDLSMEFE